MAGGGNKVALCLLLCLSGISKVPIALTGCELSAFRRLIIRPSVWEWTTASVRANSGHSSV